MERSYIVKGFDTKFIIKVFFLMSRAYIQYNASPALYWTDSILSVNNTFELRNVSLLGFAPYCHHRVDGI